MKYSRWISLLLLLIGVAALTIFVYQVDFKQVQAGWENLGFSFISLILFLVFLPVVVKAWRWQYLIRKTTGVRIGGWFSLYSIIVGNAAGSLTPGRAGEIAKPFLLKNRFRLGISQTLGCVFSERAFDLLSLLFLFFFGLVLLPSLAVRYYYTALAFLALFWLIIFLLLVFPHWFQRRADLFIDRFAPSSWKVKLRELNGNFFSSWVILRQGKVLSFVSLLSLLAMFLEVIRLFFIFRMLHLPLSFSLVMFSFAASIIFGLLTFIPGGIGATEISQAAILLTAAPLGAPVDLLKLGVLLDRFFAFYLLVGLGGLLLLGGTYWRRTGK